MKHFSGRVIGVAVAVALLLVGGWWFGLRAPQSNAIQRAHAQQAAATLKMAALQAEAKTLLRQKAELPAQEARLAALKQALPSQASLAQVIDAIHQAATAAGIELHSLSQSAATATAGSSATTPATGTLQVVTLSMSISGSYPQLMDYITKLNLLARTMVVDNMTLAAPSEAGQMTSQITGRMFFVPTGS